MHSLYQEPGVWSLCLLDGFRWGTFPPSLRASTEPGHWHSARASADGLESGAMNFLTRPRTIFLLIIIAMVVIMAIQNSYPVPIFFLFWRANVDGLLLFLLVFLVGVLAGSLLTWGWRRGRNS
jgi:uncharacterized integral membrane protein